MSAQIAAEVFDAKRVIAKINDPLRAEAYAELGIATICRTNLMADAVLGFIGLPDQRAAGRSRPARHPGATTRRLWARSADAGSGRPAPRASAPVTGPGSGGANTSAEG